MRNFWQFAIFFIAFVVSLNSTVNALSCEKIKSCYLSTECCQMDVNTKIDFDYSTVSQRNESVTTILFALNKKIHRLPILISKAFPHLQFYDAGRCSIREISKKNFEKLETLVWLDLRENQIEEVRSETFKDLISLETLILSSNKIKRMNGNTFGQLPALRQINLLNNVCIDVFVQNSLKLIATVTKKCGFEESEAVVSVSSGCLQVHRLKISRIQWFFIGNVLMSTCFQFL